jgi:hypothetical protein
MIRQKIFIVVLVYSSISLLPIASRAAADPLLPIESRLATLQNVQARFSSIVQNDPDPALVAAVYARIERPIPQDVNATQTYNCEFRFAGGAALWRREASQSMIDAARSSNTALQSVFVLMIGQGRAERLIWPYQSKLPIGDVSTSQEFPGDSTIDAALGLRLIGAQEWLSPDQLRSAGQATSPNGDITLSFKDRSGATHSLRMMKGLAYALVQYHVEYGPQTSQSTEDIDCSDFRVVSGMTMPFKISRHSAYLDSTGHVRHPITTTLVTRQYVLGDPANSADSLHIHWPKGSSIWDKRAQANVVATADDQALTDDMIAAQIQAHDVEQKALLSKTQQRIRSAEERDGATTVPATTTGK